jgi:hypothetical protein
MPIALAKKKWRFIDAYRLRNIKYKCIVEKYPATQQVVAGCYSCIRSDCPLFLRYENIYSWK